MTREQFEQILFAHVSDEVVQDMLNEYVLELESSNAKLREKTKALTELASIGKLTASQCTELAEDNAKLRKQIERLQPKDCEGNALDIADTVSMLRSEYDGDHEWDDVVVELVLTKWGGDRWIVRGSKGEAWACDCAKTGYDEDAYEGSDDVEPIDNPTLVEVENSKLRQQLADVTVSYGRLEMRCAKLRELVRDVHAIGWSGFDCTECPVSFSGRCENNGGCNWLGILTDRMRDELGVEVE